MEPQASSGNKRLEFVLQESFAVDEWEEGERLEGTNAFSFKISLQDGRNFPTLQDNDISIDAGFMHKIRVSICGNQTILELCQ